MSLKLAFAGRLISAPLISQLSSSCFFLALYVDLESENILYGDLVVDLKYEVQLVAVLQSDEL